LQGSEHTFQLIVRRLHHAPDQPQRELLAHHRQRLQ
jgi:hypothetical protein